LIPDREGGISLRDGYETYCGYLVGLEREITQGEEVILEVRDRERWERKVVRAVIARPPSNLEGGERLWVRDQKERYLPLPWSIRIIKELDPDEVEPQRRDLDKDSWTARVREEAYRRGGKNFAHYGSDGIASGYFI